MPLILLNKPYQVLCQFRDVEGRAVLADHVPIPDVYPAGRLDYNSEGLLLLTDDGVLQARISDPKYKLQKRYWVQVEGAAQLAQIRALLEGVTLNDGFARATAASLIEPPPGLWERSPPIRERRALPTSWIEMAIAEGRNRQVRRMTAAVGLPTLRLIRHEIGPFSLGVLRPGEYRQSDNSVAWQLLNG